MEMKKVLLFAGKFPRFGEDADGGSMMVYSIIEAIKNKCLLDVVFTRTFNNEFSHIDGVNSIQFETYNYRNDDKFLRRLGNREQLYKKLSDVADDYDKIIIIHISKAFGIEKLSKINKNKIIIFPMYLSTSYERSNEIPSKEYKKYESDALNSAYKIITPSNSEKNDMVSIYNVDSDKIIVIPRGYSSLITSKVHVITNELKLIYIGSIKEQKNTLQSIKILNKLVKDSIPAKLYIVGGCQNENIMRECLNYISDNSLKDNVIFTGIVSQKRLAELIDMCHINISTSNWETYGRGVFEGMAGGLPTITFDRLDCVKQYIEDEKGIKYVHTEREFIDYLKELYYNKTLYENQSKLSYKSVAILSEENERKLLEEELL